MLVSVYIIIISCFEVFDLDNYPQVCVCVCFLLIFFLTSNYLKQTNINKYILKSTHQLPKKKKQAEVVDFFEAGPKFPGKEQMLTFIEDTFFFGCEMNWPGPWPCSLT